MDVASLIRELMIVVVAGAVSATICRKLGVSLLAGYLLVGAVVGHGGLSLLEHPLHETELIAEAGALFLLFSVGIEFSFGELRKLGRFFLVAGSIQMVLVAAPLTVAARAMGLSPNAALLAACAGALSSTVLVFRALSERGEMETGSGKRAISVLLFQDVALVPLLMFLPLLTGQGEAPDSAGYASLAIKSVLFVAGVIVTHFVVSRWLVSLLLMLRSVELLVLFSVSMLGLMCLAAYRLDMPPAIGALAAGIVLSGNRLSRQVDTVLLPFRETFAAVFFVSLGMLLDPRIFLSEPILLTTGFLGIVALKALAGCIALRFVGLPWRKALGMGLVLSQLGEFSFLLVARGAADGLIEQDVYNRMLFIGMTTLIVTPLLIRYGMKLGGESEEEGMLHGIEETRSTSRTALVVGLGPIGGRIAQRLELAGVNVTLLDLSPINLHAYAQLGFTTVAGDARDSKILDRVELWQQKLAVVSVPSDEVALEIVKSLRQYSQKLAIIVRCRFGANVSGLELAGANAVVSEEVEVSEPLMQLCEQWMEPADKNR